MSKGHPVKLGYEGDSHLPPERFIRIYMTVPSSDGDIEVWFVDGEKIRNRDWVDFTQASNPWAFPQYVPRRRVILDIANEKEAIPNLIHELCEGNYMRLEGWTYEKAHEHANESEIEARKHIDAGHPERAQAILQSELRRLLLPTPSRLKSKFFRNPH